MSFVLVASGTSFAALADRPDPVLRDIAAVKLASVNAQLAADPKLSALQINVDTSGGRVLLRGTAPDFTSRERATEMASGPGNRKVAVVTSVPRRMVEVSRPIAPRVIHESVGPGAPSTFIAT